MKDIIFDNLLACNSKYAKNKFLHSCYYMSANMPTACISFIKMIQQCFNNAINGIKIVKSKCYIKKYQFLDDSIL